MVVSDVTGDELAVAPEVVRGVLSGLHDSLVERVVETAESTALAVKYLEANVVGRASLNDARHIAVATIVGADIIVSWNFKHIVHYEKIMGYEGVNVMMGHRSPRIYSPMELVDL